MGNIFFNIYFPPNCQLLLLLRDQIKSMNVSSRNLRIKTSGNYISKHEPTYQFLMYVSHQIKLTIVRIQRPYLFIG